jgi:hypothetical protein
LSQVPVGMIAVIFIDLGVMFPYMVNVAPRCSCYDCYYIQWPWDHVSIYGKYCSTMQLLWLLLYSVTLGACFHIWQMFSHNAVGMIVILVGDHELDVTTHNTSSSRCQLLLKCSRYIVKTNSNTDTHMRNYGVNLHLILSAWVVENYSSVQEIPCFCGTWRPVSRITNHVITP